MCEVWDQENMDGGGYCCSCGGMIQRTLYSGVQFKFKRVLRLSFAFCFVLAILSCTSSVSCSEQNTLISQSEVKTIEPTNNPTKVFVRRRIFRKLVKDTTNGSAEEPQSTTTPSPKTTTSARPRTLYSLVKRLDTSPQSSSTVTGNTLKSSISNSMSLAARQKFNFQSLKTRLGLAASGIAESTTTQPPTSTTTQNASLMMIPLPPSQRKPYTPVIMQVSKSTTSKPESTVQTFKLNKMFVPIGIYGKVVENNTNSEEHTTEPAVTTSSSTPVTSIRHKGTDSGENTGKSRKVKGIAESVDITYGRPNLERFSLTTEKPDIGQISITTEVNELFSGMSDMFGESSNTVRRGDHDGYGGNRRKQTFTASSPQGASGLTLMTPPKLGTQSPDDDTLLSNADSYGSYSSYASYSLPQKNKFHPSSIVDSITDSMSRIPSLVPSLFHKGLTSLASMTSSLKENPFVDENFDESTGQTKQKPLISAATTYTPKIPASVPGGYIKGMGVSSGSRDQAYAGTEMKSTGSSGSSKKASSVDMSEYEALEYFRKRPHLLAQLRKERAESTWRRSQGVRYSKGFKPATAPEPIAREYYKSTSTTTATTPEEMYNPTYRSAKKMRGSWLLRNSNEYVANKNDKLVRMWRDMLDKLTEDEEEGEHEFQGNPNSNIRRHDEHVEDSNREDPSSSSISARRSSTNPLSAHWSTIKRKYSKSQLNEAKERILTLLDSGYGDEALHDIADDEDLQHHVEYGHHDTSSHMPPPPPPRIKTLSLTKGLSGAAAGAFKDLVKYFKLGISVGTGHSREPVNYEQVVDEQEAEEIGGSEWKPVRRPLISFSAGISLKNPSSKKPAPPPHHHVHEDYDEDLPLTHYSSSTKPYIPTAYKPLNTFEHEIASSHSLKPTPYTYAEDEEIGLPPSQSLDYAEEDDSLGYGSATASSYASSQPQYSYDSAPSAPKHSHTRYTTLSPGLKRPSSDMQSGAASTWQPVSAGVPPGVNPDEYELVPSSVYLNGRNDPRDIAAVVKPAGISDELVRSALPAGLRNLRILNYPNEYRGYASSLNSISQVLGKGTVGVKPTTERITSFKHAMKKLRENYVAKESAYLPQGDDEFVEQGRIQEQESSVRGVVGGGSFTGGSYTGGVYTTAAQSPRGVYTTAAQSPRGVYTTGIQNSGIYTQGGLGSLGATYYSPVVHQSGLAGALSGLEGGNVFATADRINNLGRGSSGVGGLSSVYAQQLQVQQQQQQHQAPQGGQKDALGFSTNYNLPGNIDPDIAALLKSELDKDDVPDDIRQEFIEAKEQERKEKAQKQAQYQSATRRVDDNEYSEPIRRVENTVEYSSPVLTSNDDYTSGRVDTSVDLAQQTLIDSLLSSAAKSVASPQQRVASAPEQYSIPEQQYSAPQQQQFSAPQQQQVPPPQQHSAPQQQYNAPQQQQQVPPQYQAQAPTHPTPRFQAQSRVFHHSNVPPPRGPPVLTTRFFAPIPITPTLMTTALKNPRYSSPVPRYVIELAKKLQGDKSVQGIVRVSAKRGRGLPPIEYLYPVKG